MNAILGKKIGMTNVFSWDGKLVPVTVVQVGPCVVTQVKTMETDGYTAIQLGYDEKSVDKLNKPIAGHLKKATDKGFRVLREFRADNVSEMKPGMSLDISMFTVGEKINVSGISKGRGFQGTVKRHGFSRGPETHGCRNHRKPGSVGNSAWPSKIVKGKKMPGHMGVQRETVKNLTIIDIKAGDNLLLVKGCVPGFKTGIIELHKADKKK